MPLRFFNMRTEAQILSFFQEIGPQGPGQRVFINLRQLGNRDRMAAQNPFARDLYGAHAVKPDIQKRQIVQTVLFRNFQNGVPQAAAMDVRHIANKGIVSAGVLEQIRQIIPVIPIIRSRVQQ